ncbi:MAG TPA: ABC transporter permease [Jatrophihabitans sp.]|nr:ABC transporter permease [Jatrophihabitans sp.]
MTISTISPRHSAMRTAVATEVRLFGREPASLAWGFVLPLIAFVVLACVPGIKRPSADLHGASYAQVYQSIIILLATAILGIVALPPVLGAYRERGVLRRLAVTPLAPTRILSVQMIIHFGLAVLTAVAVLVVGGVAGIGPGGQFVGWAVAFLLTAAALLGLGLLIAAVAPNARVAGAIGGVLFFPMMFSAGLWIPRQTMPDLMRTICDWTPLGAANRAMSGAVVGVFPSWATLLVLAGYAAVFGRLAVRSYRWD